MRFNILIFIGLFYFNMSVIDDEIKLIARTALLVRSGERRVLSPGHTVEFHHEEGLVQREAISRDCERTDSFNRVERNGSVQRPRDRGKSSRATSSPRRTNPTARRVQLAGKNDTLRHVNGVKFVSLK